MEREFVINVIFLQKKPLGIATADLTTKIPEERWREVLKNITVKLTIESLFAIIKKAKIIPDYLIINILNYMVMVIDMNSGKLAYSTTMSADEEESHKFVMEFLLSLNSIFDRIVNEVLFKQIAKQEKITN